MNELTKREQIALAMLQGKPDLVRSNYEVKISFILDAFNFADIFIDMSEGREGEIISEMENIEARR